MPSTATDFVTELSKLKFENVFNPYSDICLKSDKENAHAIRQSNLRRALEAVHGRKCSLWVARDLGYRGGRRTGLALTDEPNLHRSAEMFGVGAFERATVDSTVAERTASTVWDMQARTGDLTFMWNVFPLHPHDPGEPFTNRSHSRAEAAACRDLFLGLFAMLAPVRVVAIGADAARSLAGMGIEARPVRHPSYGGERAFRAGMAEIYDLRH